MKTTNKNQPKPKRTAHTAPQARRGRTAPAEATRKATAAKRAPKAAQGAKASLPTIQTGESKRAAVLLLLQREGGTSLDEIVATTGWQRHSVRGLLSTLGSKGGHKIAATKREDGVRMYSAK